MKKGILIGISGILVVGLVVGCIVGVTKIHKSSGGDKDALSSTSKAVAAICAPTDYKQACIDSLKSVSHNESATLQQLIQASIQYTIEEVMRVGENISKVKDEAKDSLNKMAADDCQELLQYAADELQDSISMVGDPNLYTKEDRDVFFTNWFSGIIAIQDTCNDGFTSMELKSLTSGKLARAFQLSYNILTMFIRFNDLMKSFNIPVNVTNPTPSARRLLEAGGYPTWISAADRKLLQKNNVRFDAVVAQDGSGQFKSIAAALAAYPKNLRGKYNIHVKAGTYKEYITIHKNQMNVSMYGDGYNKTIITGSRSNTAHYPLKSTATFSVYGMRFTAKGIRFENTAGPEGHQAVALALHADAAALHECEMSGYQDTLYANAHRHFIRDSVISGTIDFIFGNGATIIQNSKIVVRKPMKEQYNVVTAHGRLDAGNITGIIIQNCSILPEKQLEEMGNNVKTYLGRPWKPYSRAVIMESKLESLIDPTGWITWDNKDASMKGPNTAYFAEFANRGLGSNTDKRVSWIHKIIHMKEVTKFRVAKFIGGAYWLPVTGFPFYLGMTK